MAFNPCVTPSVFHADQHVMEPFFQIWNWIFKIDISEAIQNFNKLGFSVCTRNVTVVCSLNKEQNTTLPFDQTTWFRTCRLACWVALRRRGLCWRRRPEPGWPIPPRRAGTPRSKTFPDNLSSFLNCSHQTSNPVVKRRHLKSTQPILISIFQSWRIYTSCRPSVFLWRCRIKTNLHFYLHFDLNLC